MSQPSLISGLQMWMRAPKREHDACDPAYAATPHGNCWGVRGNVNGGLQHCRQTLTVWATREALPTGKIPWRKKWQPTPVLLPGKSHGQRSLVGYSPWSHKLSDFTYQEECKKQHPPYGGFPGGASGKESACWCWRDKRCRFKPWSGRAPGKGNGNPLQYSCLENPMDRGAWWAAVQQGHTASDTIEAT